MEPPSIVPDCDVPQPVPGRWARIFCYVRRISDAYAEHQCTFMACACAYCALLSLVPLLIIGIAVLGYLVGGSVSALNEVITAIRGYVPINPAFLRDTLVRVLQDRTLIGLLGLVGLLYGAHQTFLALQPAMNIIWHVRETRHWLRQRLVAIGATLCALVLLGCDTGLSVLFAYVTSAHLPALHNWFTSVVVRVVFTLLPVLVVTLLFAVIYCYLPARRVPWGPALLGAAVAAVLWELTKVGFGVFLLYVHSYDRLYGSLSSLVVLVVWMYYSMAILLLGAEITADTQAARFGPDVAEARAHSGADLAAARGTSQAPVE